MKTKKIISVLALTLAMVMGLTLNALAESNKVNGNCYFNGSEIISSFDSDEVNDRIRELEPGDDVTFEVEFENRCNEKTHWYMKNEALETLEQSYDRAENGGYTYTLTHISPDGEETVLFDNSAVGGAGTDGHSYSISPKSSKTSHGTENTGEGLHQATNATDDWFFIQTLGPAPSGKGKTRLYVKFDGESEVNDYMDTAGELLIAYAVELDTDSPDTPKRRVKTGDSTNILMYLAVMLMSMLMLIFTIMSYRKDRRTAKAEAGAEAGTTGKAVRNRKERR